MRHHRRGLTYNNNSSSSSNTNKEEEGDGDDDDAPPPSHIKHSSTSSKPLTFAKQQVLSPTSSVAVRNRGVRSSSSPPTVEKSLASASSSPRMSSGLTSGELSEQLALDKQHQQQHRGRRKKFKRRGEISSDSDNCSKSKSIKLSSVDTKDEQEEAASKLDLTELVSYCIKREAETMTNTSILTRIQTPPSDNQLEGEVDISVNEDDDGDDNEEHSNATSTTTTKHLNPTNQDYHHLHHHGHGDVLRRGDSIDNRHVIDKLTEAQLDKLGSLIKIIRNGDYREFLELLEEERGFKNNLLNVFVDGQTALHYSLIYGRSLAWCKQLVLNGANPNLTNRAGWHPIHLAAFNGSRETMRYLIDCIAN